MKKADFGVTVACDAFDAATLRLSEIRGVAALLAEQVPDGDPLNSVAHLLRRLANEAYESLTAQFYKPIEVKHGKD